MQARIKTLLSLSVAAAVGAGAALAQGTAPAAGGHSKQMHEQMMSGMQQMQSMQMSGDMDKDFANMMRHHHMQGIAMAKMEMAHGKSPEMKRMADKIIKSQQKEIAEFDKWLQKHK
jgi:uncharacterized protein (DUF305 family)